ncbi:ABC transporter ATP-binding protein [Desulfoferrobacter suflitae]|uniref:ABC transporter ATP-binding protein n=1 Tax=Desulfoferrobacter suflitae TaxID=2865782 RepID=UPI0021644F6A|nr:ABC transporter ATP-binding protein [Desulfoferrobacter suflitae]MCK8602780.1 ABC transporter ATP-binding protein/permease [Desulfoferrobacter suflitae]
MQHSYGYFEEDHLGQIGNVGLWRRLLIFVAPYWKWVSLAVFLSLIVTAASLALPRLIQLAMDEYILQTRLSIDQRVSGLLYLSLIFCGIILIGFVANFLQVIVLEWAGQKIMHAMRQNLFVHLQRLNLSFFNAHPVGKLVTRLTNDIQNMYEMFTSVIVTLFNDGLKLIGIMAILFWMNWRLTLLLSVMLPIMLIITLWFGRLARDAFRKIRTNLARINAFIQEAVSGITIIQLFLREQDTLDRFTDLNRIYYRSTIYQIHIFGLFIPLIEVMGSVTMALIIWYGGREIIQDHMTLGILTAFISYMRLFFQPIRELSQKYSIVQSAMASAERIFQLLETRDVLPVRSDPVVLNDLQGAIEFGNVTFEYDPGHPILKDLSFRVEPGETLALVGATGSGKTTIINLLERFYDPGEGDIKLDGISLKNFDPHRLREQIGLVMQDVFVVPGSVRENILLNLEADDDQLERLVQLSQLSALVNRLPDGLATRIGEGGMDLSAGQKQLLAFARVLARDPSILVLDEATANVDSETEMLIEQAIQAALANRTSIVIAHRLSTIKRADRILVMDHGTIVEQGTHRELMAQKGVYYHLQSLQNDLGRNEVIPAGGRAPVRE